MRILLKQAFMLAVFCLVTYFHITEAGYGYYGFNQQDHTEHCVQMNPNDAGNQNIYKMAGNPELFPQQLNKPGGSFDNVHFHQQGMGGPGFMRTNEEIYQSFDQQALQRPIMQQLGSLPQLHHYSHHLAASPTPTYSKLPPVNLNHMSHFSLSKSDTEPSSKISLSDKGTTARVEGNKNEISSSNNQFTTNPEQFRALLDHEVLGSPNLAFSNDEIMSTQPQMPFHSQGSYMPVEYLNDPILRTFYNIDDNMEKMSYPGSQLRSPNNFSPATPTGSQILDGGCDCPLNFQPIFIAIPWFNSFYNDILSNIESRPGIKIPMNNNIQQSNSNKDYSGFDSNYLAQARTNDDTTSTKDFSIQNSKINSTESETTSTQTPESSEEDLFAEDITIKGDIKYKENDRSQEETEDDEQHANKASISSTTPPAAEIFRTMLDAAKKHSKLANAESESSNSAQTLPNKRSIQYIDSSTPYPSHVKKEYVRKLKNNDN